MASLRRRITAIALILLALGACSSAPRRKDVTVVEKKNEAAQYTTFGNRSFAQGDYAGARTFFEQALAANLSVDNQAGVVQSLGSLGRVHAAVGELDEAEELYGRAARLAADLGDATLVAQCSVNLGELLLRRDRAEEARSLLVAALAGSGAIAGSREVALLQHTLAVAEKWLGNLDEAERLLLAALETNTKLRSTEDIASNRYMLASVASKRQDYAAAMEHATLALEADKSVENSLGIAQDLLALGIVSTRLGRHGEAFAYLERSYGIYQALGSEAGRLEVLPYLAEAARAAGLDAEASAYERLLQPASPK